MFKIILLAQFLSAFCYDLKGQTPPDSNFRVDIINFEWMPDNMHLIIHLMKFDKRHKIGPESKVYLLDLESKKMDLLLEKAQNPSPSPDGKFIAFVKNLPNNKSSIYLYDTKSKKETPLSSDTTDAYAPQWSPDGKEIVFDEVKNRVYNICIMDLATSSIRRLTQSGQYSSFNPIWSPDGKRIVYFLEKNDNHDQIYLTDPHGHFYENLTNDTTTLNFYPSWLTADKIIFGRAPKKLMMLDMKANSLSELGNYGSVWARYNSHIMKLAYVSSPPESELMILDLTSKRQKPVIAASAIESMF